MSIKFNIGSVHDSSCPERPLLRKATTKIGDEDFVEYRRGLIAYMILEQQITPCIQNEKYKGKTVDELQEIVVRKLVRLGYDFGEQGPEAQAFIDKIKSEEEATVRIKINQDVAHPLLHEASKKFMTERYIASIGDNNTAHNNGLLARCILEKGWKPCELNKKYADRPLASIQRSFIKKLVKLSYDFGEQGDEEAVRLIISLRGSVTRKIDNKKEKTFSQTRTVTVVLERKGFTHQRAIDADESFSGKNTIEKMKADGFKVVSASYSQLEGSVGGGGIGLFGWKEVND